MTNNGIQGWEEQGCCEKDKATLVKILFKVAKSGTFEVQKKVRPLIRGRISHCSTVAEIEHFIWGGKDN